MLRGALQRSRGTQLSTESKKRVVGRIAVVGCPVHCCAVKVREKPTTPDDWETSNAYLC